MRTSASGRSFDLNDMVVDAKGRAYVGNFGFDPPRRRATDDETNLHLVEADGSVREVASDLAFRTGLQSRRTATAP